MPNNHRTTNTKNNFEYFINNGKVYFTNENEFLTIKKQFKQKYKEINTFKEAIFTYYSIYGTNFDAFKRATTFDELFEILEREESCLFCLIRELGKEYESIIEQEKCNELKLNIESENKQEINGVILRVNWNRIDKYYTIDGFLRFSSGRFEPLNNIYEKVAFNHETVKEIVQENLEHRKYDRAIELQLILPNELYSSKIDFQCANRKIKVIKRLLLRIENYNQLDIDAIRYWQRNSNFYQNHQEDNIEEDYVHTLDKYEIDEFQEYDDDKHICLLSDKCLHIDIKEIYIYGVPIAFYSYSSECKIIDNLDSTN
jgi:hypothetical protein